MVALGVEHVSCYGLTVEAGTPYARWFARDPGAFADDALEARLYAIAIDRLRAAGYEHYEISNWAKPGFRSQHNAIYWANEPYLGLGGRRGVVPRWRSARRTRRASTSTSTPRSQAVPIPGESERLEGAAQAGEAIMLALRTAEGVDVARFRERYGIDMHGAYGKVIGELVEAGMLVSDASHVRLTERGRFLANDVCGAFLAG